MLNVIAMEKAFPHSHGKILKEGFILQEIFINFINNSDSNLTQTEMLTLKLFPNRTLIRNLT